VRTLAADYDVYSPSKEYGAAVVVFPWRGPIMTLPIDLEGTDVLRLADAKGYVCAC